MIFSNAKNVCAQSQPQALIHKQTTNVDFRQESIRFGFATMSQLCVGALHDQLHDRLHCKGLI